MTIKDRVRRALDYYGMDKSISINETIEEALKVFGQDLINEMHARHLTIDEDGDPHMLRKWYNTGMTDAEVIIRENLK